jgi:hypothetical protein
VQTHLASRHAFKASRCALRTKVRPASVVRCPGSVLILFHGDVGTKREPPSPIHIFRRQIWASRQIRVRSTALSQRRCRARPDARPQGRAARSMYIQPLTGYTFITSAIMARARALSSALPRIGIQVPRAPLINPRHSVPCPTAGLGGGVGRQGEGPCFSPSAWC